MTLKCSLLLLSILSSTSYAKTYNLDTVVNSKNIDTIVSEMVKTFKKGTVDPSSPIGVSGTYDLDENNKLTAINVNHASFKVVNVPLIGTYKTEVSISATFENGNCNNFLSSSSSVISGDPAWVNPLFTADLARRKNDAISILINNSELSKYCTKASYNVYFY
jgi:hypothetical protein